MVTVMQEGNRRVIAAADEAARRIKLHPGMTLAHAQSLVPDLHVVEAAPQEDEAALEQLGLWCTRYSPLVTPDPPDGVFIDIAGSAHLFKGETALLQDISSRLAAAWINGKVAVADTPGCAWAVARFGGESIVAPGRIADALGGLPVSALRISQKTVGSLHDMGIERIAHLATKPPAILILAVRFIVGGLRCPKCQGLR
jgi:protein ImuB